MPKFELGGYFMLRSPLLSFEECLVPLWSGRSRKDKLHVMCRLLARPEIREALWISNPELAQGLPTGRRLTAKTLDARFKEKIPALYRYLIRMGSRPTPFGLMAGVSSGKIGPRPSALTLSARARWRKVARPDSALVFHAWNAALTTARFPQNIRWRAHPTLTRLPGRICYFLETTLPSLEIKRHLAGMDASPYLDCVLDAAADWVATEELVTALTQRWSTESSSAVLEAAEIRAHAREFIDDLIEAQLLVPDLAPPISGKDSDAARASRLKHELGAVDAAALLSAADRASRGISKRPPGRGLDTYPALHAQVNRVTRRLGVRISPKQRVQVDLHKPTRGLRLDSAWESELARAFEVLGGFKDPQYIFAPLATLQQMYANRHGQATIPLAELFDPQIGFNWEIDFATRPRIAKTTGWLESQVSRLPPPEPGRQKPWILRLDSLQPPRRFWGGGQRLAALGSLVLEDRFLLQGISVGGGNQLMARFLGDDPALEAQVRAEYLAHRERSPDTLYAELISTDNQRYGNVLRRPTLCEYEIVLSPRSGVPQERQLRIADLTIGIRNGRFEIRCPKLGHRRIIPQLNSAHNYAIINDPYYRLLAMLQEPSSPHGMAWSWDHLPHVERRPRVELGRVILAPQEWHVPLARLRELGSPTKRAELGLPRIVSLAAGDQKLPLNLADPLNLESVLASKLPGHLKLVEWLHPSFRSPVRGAEGAYANELLVPIQGRSDASRGHDAPPIPIEISPTFRRRAPGTDWIHLKLFLNSPAMDPFLIRKIGPLLRQGLARGCRNAFFIRYSDEDTHVRLRFRVGEDREWPAQLLAIASSLLEARQIRDFTVCPYVREIERYGGPEAMEPVEDIFTADSVSALAWLAFEDEHPLTTDLPKELSPWKNRERIIFALRGADATLRAAGLDLEERLRWTERLRAIGAPSDPSIKEALAALMRERFRKPDWEAASPLAPAMTRILEERTRAAAPAFAKIHELRAQGRFVGDADEFLLSLCHMQFNRLRNLADPPSDLAGERELLAFLHLLYGKERSFLASRSRPVTSFAKVRAGLPKTTTRAAPAAKRRAAPNPPRQTP